MPARRKQRESVQYAERVPLEVPVGIQEALESTWEQLQEALKVACRDGTLAGQYSPEHAQAVAALMETNPEIAAALYRVGFQTGHAVTMYSLQMSLVDIGPGCLIHGLAGCPDGGGHNQRTVGRA